MNRRRFIALTLGAGAAASLAPGFLPRRLARVGEKCVALGGEVSLVAYHEDAEVAREAIQAAFRALNDLEDALSLYRPNSQLCQLNRDGILRDPHRDLVAVLNGALEWARRTDGAFDPTVQPLWKVHSAAQAPDGEAIRDARRRVNWQHVQVSVREIRLGPGQAITLNGIAQGFAADRLREIFVARGIRHALLNTGEYCAMGAKPGGAPWGIGIQHPRVPEAYAVLAAVRDRFLSTSGDYETRFSEDFSSHHIIDPATGRSPGALASVTALARTGMEADAVSTAVFVMGPERGLQLAARRGDIDLYMVLKGGQVIATPQFPRLT